MKILSFDYEKADGKKSKRVLLPTFQPTTMWSGTDLSPLSDEDQVLYVRKRELLQTDYLMAIRELDKEFDVEHQFRQFKAENMTNMLTEDI